MKIVTIFLLLVSISSMAMVSTDKDKKELRKIYEQSKNEEKQKITLYAVGAGVSFFGTLLGVYQSRNFFRTMYNNEMQQLCTVTTQSSIKDSRRVVGCIVCGIVTGVLCLGLCDHCQRYCKYKKVLRDL
jgi:hypothetical protein